MEEIKLKGETPRILIVDDDPQIVAVIKQVFKKDGFELEDAGDGFDTGIKMLSFKPHLVLLDLKMPGIDGFSVARKLKKDPITQGVKVIILSGYITEEVQEELMAIGVEAILEKPFSPIGLREEIIKALTN